MSELSTVFTGEVGVVPNYRECLTSPRVLKGWTEGRGDGGPTVADLVNAMSKREMSIDRENIVGNFIF